MKKTLNPKPAARKKLEPKHEAPTLRRAAAAAAPEILDRPHAPLNLVLAA